MLYLDSSAIVKLVVSEPETNALVQVVRSDPEIVASIVARVEVLRAVYRARIRRTVTQRAESVMDRMALLRLDDWIVATASTLHPRELRSLDAIHLATALSLAPNLSALVTYDTRLASAAASAGIDVLAPQ